MPTDLTVKLENSPGTLAALGEALGNAGVNIEAIAGFAVGAEGIAHLVVTDPDAAKSALAGAGITVTDSREAVTVSLSDKPGTLGAYARKLAEAGVNIEAAYVAETGPGGVEMIVLVDDPEKARSVGA